MTPLNCSEFDAALDKLERELAELPVVDIEQMMTELPLREHAAICSRCAVLWEDRLLLRRPISQWKADVPEADVLERVLNEWRAEQSATNHPAASCGPMTPSPRSPRITPSTRPAQHSSRSETQVSRFAVAAVASSVIVLVVAVWNAAVRPVTPSANSRRLPTETRQQSRERGTASPPVEHDSPPIEHDSPLVENTPESVAEHNTNGNRPRIAPERAGQRSAAARSGSVDIDGLVAEFQQQYVDLKGNVSDLIASVRMDLSPLHAGLFGTSSSSPDESPSLEKSLQRGEEPPGGWTQRLPPIQRDIRKAFNFLRETVPGTGVEDEATTLPYSL